MHLINTRHTQVVETAASHGRIALVLETLVRGVWEQTSHNEDGAYNDEADDIDDNSNEPADRKPTIINGISLV